MGDREAARGDLSALPLGLLLGRVSGALRADLLAACSDGTSDVRLVGLVLAVRSDPHGTQADHARFLGIDLNTASRLFVQAEARGLLRRVPSEADRRALALQLTDEGRALAEEGSRALDRIDAYLRAGIGDDEFDAFRASAERMLQLLSSV